jgi:hypothetical protein
MGTGIARHQLEAPMKWFTEDMDRPHEWLLKLDSEPHAYARLVEAAGSLAEAAYRLARARCRTSDRSTDVPSRSELGAAALRIVSRTGETRGAPTGLALARECESRGLPVIGLPKVA